MTLKKKIAKWRKALGWRLVTGDMPSGRVVIVLSEQGGRVVVDHHGLPTVDHPIDVPDLSRAQVVGMDTVNHLQGRSTEWRGYVGRLH